MNITKHTYERIWFEDQNYERYNFRYWKLISQSSWGQDKVIRGDELRKLEKRYQEIQATLKEITPPPRYDTEY